ncbi:MAG TPA: hypothetical protein PKE31_02665 [Pseudomonadota bacterium]|nr:hypothetical protein [Pseudomonadota bacterium]
MKPSNHGPPTLVLAFGLAWRDRLFAFVLSLVFSGLVSIGGMRSVWAETVQVDQTQDIVLSTPRDWPQIGPPNALLTLDIKPIIGEGEHCGPFPLSELLRHTDALPDVRVRVFAQSSASPTAIHGAELYIAACEQQPVRCLTFLAEYCSQKKWLAESWKGNTPPMNVGEMHEDLVRAAQRNGISPELLIEFLRSGRSKIALRRLWATSKDRPRDTLFLNGSLWTPNTLTHLLRIVHYERIRARNLVLSGVPLSNLLEYRPAQGPSLDEYIPAPPGATPKATAPPIVRPVQIDATRLPCTGPLIAPVTVVHVFYPDAPKSAQHIADLHEVYSRFADRVRLCVLYLPSPGNSRITELLAQISEVDQKLLFEILSSLPRPWSDRSITDRYAIIRRLRQRGLLGKVEAHQGAARTKLKAYMEWLERHNLFPENQLLINGKVRTSFDRVQLSGELEELGHRGLFSTLRKKIRLPP